MYINVHTYVRAFTYAPLIEVKIIEAFKIENF